MTKMYVLHSADVGLVEGSGHTHDQAKPSV